MIYSKKALCIQFSIMATLIKRVAKKRKEEVRNLKPKRKSPIVTRLKDPDYWSSTWGQLAVQLASIEGGPSIDTRIGKLFRRRFRVPYVVYCDLVTICLDKKIFGENCNKDTDIANRKIRPVEIKLLSVLRILGRNWNFDDISEATLM